MRALIIAALISVAAPVAAETDDQNTLAGFLAAADGKEEVRKLDREFAGCITEHASADDTQKLVKLAEKDDQKGFLKAIDRTTAKNEELQSCLEGAALTAMMGF